MSPGKSCGTSNATRRGNRNYTPTMPNLRLAERKTQT